MPLALHGQAATVNALGLEAGTRARILRAEADSRITLITVASARPDSLHYYSIGASDPRSIGWRQITRMDASAGQHRHVGRGLGFGLLAGTLAGIGLGAAGQHGEARALNELGGAI